MLLSRVVGLVGGTCVLLAASWSHAQCTKDTDCKGDRICEEGSCMAPPPPAATLGAGPPAAAPDAGATATAASDASAGGAPLPDAAAATAPATAPSRLQPLEPVPDAPPKMKRHSTGMMAGGIVMVSFVPVALLVSLVANAQQTACQSASFRYDTSSGIYTTRSRGDCDEYDPTIYGGLIVALGLAGGGIPLIVIGGKKKPVATASVTPWATPRSGGMGLRLEL